MFDKFITFWDLLVEAQEKRLEINLENMCKYWIDIVDDYLGWIGESELVLIGAYTWVGKSDLAYNIAIHNASRGKKVMMFSLEWDINEMAYRYLQKKINTDGGDTIRTVDYRFNIKDVVDRETMAVAKTPQEILDNILVFKKEQIPTVDDIVECIQSFRDSVDMIVIDHLHYMDFWNKAQHEWLGNIMRELKTTTDIIRKPIVLVSHLKNPTDPNKEPTIYDFHGSSNIGKEWTTALLLKKEKKNNIETCVMNNLLDNKRYAGTKIYIKKSRIGLWEATFNLVYDIYEKQYINHYSEIAMDIEWNKNVDYKDLISMW